MTQETAAPETVAATEPTSPAVLKIDDPTSLEVCDRCSSTALWRVVFTKGELTFCGHHAVAYGFVARGESHAAYEN